MIDPSLLTKFRKTRITEDILEEMLKETIQQALDKKLIKSGTIIVDSTHTNASVRAKSPTQILRDMSKQLRKEIYKKCIRIIREISRKAIFRSRIRGRNYLYKKSPSGIGERDSRLRKSEDTGNCKKDEGVA